MQVERGVVAFEWVGSLVLVLVEVAGEVWKLVPRVAAQVEASLKKQLLQVAQDEVVVEVQVEIQVCDTLVEEREFLV